MTPIKTPIIRERRRLSPLVLAIFFAIATTQSLPLKFHSAQAAEEDELQLDDEFSEGDFVDEGAKAAPNKAKSDAAPPEDLILDELGDPSSPNSPAKSDDKFLGNHAEVSVTDIRVQSRKDGDTVVIETSQPATYYTRDSGSQNQAVVEIANAQLPDRFKKPIFVNSAQGLGSVSAMQDPSSGTIRVVIQYKGNAQPEVRQEGRQLVIVNTEPIAEIDAKPTLGKAPKAVQAATQRDSRILPSSSLNPLVSENIKFYGKPISIEFRDTPVRDVIGLIAEQSGANIVLAQEVEGNISVKLRQVPWDQALLIVMKAKNLGYVRQGSILRVAPYKVLFEETEALRKVMAAQKASQPLSVKVIPVSYAKVLDLEKQIAPFLDKERGKVVSDTRTNAVVVTDTPEVIERVTQLVKALDLPPLQVLIEGKVVEARETFTRSLGINWSSSGMPVNMGGNRQFNQTLRTNMQVPLNGGLLDFRIGQFDVFGDITARLGLMEQQDQIKVVASPRVVAMNNEAATVVQGTNVATTTTTQTAGGTLSNTTFVPIEMRLEVTPQVTSESDVIMQINIKRDFEGRLSINQSAPDINHREAKTKVLVPNGQTTVIGGVYDNNESQSTSGVPWLKDIPVLGWLFKTNSTKREKTELLVFLTPRILNAETSLQKENNF